jgi:hypothetical protein
LPRWQSVATSGGGELISSGGICRKWAISLGGTIYGRWQIEIFRFEERHSEGGNNKGYRKLAAAVVTSAVRDLYRRRTKCEQSRNAEKTAIESLYWLAFSPQCRFLLESLDIDQDPLAVFQEGLPERLPGR